MIKILDFDKVAAKEIFSRVEPAFDVEEIVSGIIANVRQNGDSALINYTEKFDGVKLSAVQLSQEEMIEALDQTDPEFLRILERAAENIRKFHTAQVRRSFILNDEPGIVMGQKVIPIDKAGLYVPGGTAAYPSTVLMDAIPAKIAGVKEVVMVTPPMKNGKVNPAIIAAASVAGVDKIFKVGGAQAIAALAYGTESIPKVDKIVGPGNAFVAEAKRQVFGKVSIDMIAGPSEILIVSDEMSNPKHLAADLLSQAEHDKAATAVLITLSRAEAEAVRDRIEERLKRLLREDIARASVDSNGKILIAESIGEAAALSNELAPEHLEISTDDPYECLRLIKNAGSIFLGRETCEPLGDYFAGPNHTLPTMGTAKFSSALSVDDFVKRSQFLCYSSKAFRRDAEDIIRFAEAEGLTGHAEAIRARL